MTTSLNTSLTHEETPNSSTESWADSGNRRLIREGVCVFAAGSSYPFAKSSSCVAIRSTLAKSCSFGVMVMGGLVVSYVSRIAFMNLALFSSSNRLGSFDPNLRAISAIAIPIVPGLSALGSPAICFFMSS